MTKVLGHRGLRQSKGTDENSLAAVETAFKEADGAEIDVSVSAEDTPFVVHDIGRGIFSRTVYILKEQLNKTSAKSVGKKRLDQMKDKEIEKLRLKKGAKLPKLALIFELAAKYPGKTINIELKGEGSVGPVLKAIHRAVAAGYIQQEQIILSSFDHAAILEAKRKGSSLKCGLILAASARGNALIYPWSGDKTRRYNAFNKKTLASNLTRNIRPDYFVMTAGSVNAKKIKEIKAHYPDAKLMVWTSREKPPSRNGLVSRFLHDPEIRPHLDTVITDHPKQMKTLISAMEKRK